MKNNEINLHISSKLFTFAHRTTNKSGFGAVGSAHVWGARGRWFESSNPDLFEDKGLKFSPFCFIGNAEALVI